MTENTTKPENSEPVAGPVQRGVRPLRAYGVAYSDGGRVIVLCNDRADADAHVRTVGGTARAVPLYDQAALDAAMAAARDCRTCARYTTASGGCVSVLRCVGGDRYAMTAPRQFWEAAPVEPAPF